MKLNDVLALINAGYTKEEITAMCADTSEPAQAAASSVLPSPSAEETAAGVKTEEAEHKATAPAEQPEPDRFAQLEAKLNQLIGITQNANLNANQTNATPSRSDTDILGSVIAPPRKEKNK